MQTQDSSLPHEQDSFSSWNQSSRTGDSRSNPRAQDSFSDVHGQDSYRNSRKHDSFGDSYDEDPRHRDGDSMGSWRRDSYQAYHHNRQDKPLSVVSGMVDADMPATISQGACIRIQHYSTSPNQIVTFHLPGILKEFIPLEG